MEEEKNFLQKEYFRTHQTTAKQKEGMWNAIEAEMGGTARTPSYLTSVKWISAAAAAIALLFVLNQMLFPSKTAFQTAFAEIQNIQLPDGSEVVLNANSALTYSTSWKGAKIREVWLNGEGHFSIISAKKQNGKPFIVHTPQGDIKVTGTTFNANSRAEVLQVVLTEGAVELLLDNQTAVQLLPGELISYQEEIKKEYLKNTDVFTSWTKKQLVFDDTPLSHSIKFIEEHYGYEVLIHDQELLNRKLTGTLPNPSLDVLLKAISTAFDVKVEKEKNQYLIIGK